VEGNMNKFFLALIMLLIPSIVSSAEVGPEAQRCSILATSMNGSPLPSSISLECTLNEYPRLKGSVKVKTGNEYKAFYLLIENNSARENPLGIHVSCDYDASNEFITIFKKRDKKDVASWEAVKKISNILIPLFLLVELLTLFSGDLSIHILLAGFVIIRIIIPCIIYKQKLSAVFGYINADISKITDKLSLPPGSATEHSLIIRKNDVERFKKSFAEGLPVITIKVKPESATASEVVIEIPPEDAAAARALF
jgi:hypothetical protein